MISIIFCLKLVFLWENFVHSYYINANNTNITLTNFSFGSCYNYRHKNKIFKTIQKNKPQIWIWTGDAVYIKKNDNPELMFNNIKEEKYYKKLRETIPTIGIWDDNDYGKNDGNSYFKEKDLYKKFYLDFVDEPSDSIRRKDGRGIFTSYSFGDLSTHKTVKFILLDIRYNKSNYFDGNSDILGEDQWEWLETELTNSNETFTFLVSGSQFLPFNRFLTESWYYNSRIRLINLINKTQKSGVIIISGDIHSGQILRTPCILPKLGYHLHEITSSGLTHYLPFGEIIFDYILPNDYMLLPTVTDFNFGLIHFVWGDNILESQIEINLKNLENKFRTHFILKYTDLVFNSTTIFDDNDTCSLRIFNRIKPLKEFYNYYRKNPSHILFLALYIFPIILLNFILWASYKMIQGIRIILISKNKRD